MADCGNVEREGRLMGGQHDSKPVPRRSAIPFVPPHRLTLALVPRVQFLPVQLPGLSYGKGSLDAAPEWLAASPSAIPVPNMLAVRIQAIDGARTFTLQDSQPCRPLPSIYASSATSR